MESAVHSVSLRVLVVDDEPNVRRTLVISLEADGHQVTAVGNTTDALAEAGRNSFDLAFVDLRIGSHSGMDLIPPLLTGSPWMQLVVITGHGTIESAVEAMKRGASDFLTKPFTPAQVRLVIEKVVTLRAMERRVAGLEQAVSDSEPLAVLESGSPAMRRAAELAHQVAPSDSTILLRGESGVGKGVFAQAIHRWSHRAAAPFVTVSCPSLTATLLESELFGHVKGSFTGATRDQQGRIAIADGGTLFLDEIGDLPLEIQPKLLRFMQEKRYERVGDHVTRRADVRLVCATNADLEVAVREKRFREDLYYRINVIQIEAPPLRERTADIVGLATGMLDYYRGGRRIVGFTPEALEAMQRYAWPGNVRELKNAIERAVILCRTDRIGVELLPNALSPTTRTADVALGDPVPFEKIEEAHIRRVVAQSKSLEDAAAALDVDVATLWRKRRKYGI
jgi:two-component system, NtrC family, response regulator AlgB